MAQRLIAIVSVMLVLLTGVLLWNRLASPSDGTVAQLSNAPWHGDRIRLHFVLDSASELRAGDEVTAINGRPLATAANSAGAERRRLRSGERFTYTVIRDGQARDVMVRLGDFPLREFLFRNWSLELFLGSLLTIAAFVFLRRPGDPAAQALLLVAAFSMCGAVAWLLGDQAVSLALRGPSILDLAGELALALVWAALVRFTLVAPGARLRAGWPSYLAAFALPIGLHGAYLAVALPGAQSHLEAAGRVVQVSLVPSSVLPAVVAILMVVSYRSTRDEGSRRRLRWVLATFIFAAAAWLGFWTLPDVLGQPVLREDLVPLMFVPSTLALGAAILRYRLFDIEVIVRRSLLYSVLTACVLAIYLITAGLLSRAVGPRPGLVALLGSGLVALSAQPLRNWLQRRVGRLIYGERDDPYEVISRLDRVDTAAAPRVVLLGVVKTLAQTLRLPYAAIELFDARGAPTIEASHGQPQGTPSVLPLTHDNATVGRLLLDVGSGREPFGPHDQRLLDSLTRQVSGVASRVLLTAALQRSREQLVMAREEERRRLHHRLHDGLGSSLAAAMMQMETAKHLLGQDPDGAKAQLDELVVKTRQLIGDVRGLVYNLRPPALDQLGLAGAIRERATCLAQPAGTARVTPRVVVEEACRLGDLPAAVEVAAFWIAVEAVNNAVRHAAASTCQVRLARDGGLTLEVRDDGRGLPDGVRSGGGLISMRERAEELGGVCTVEPSSVGGTVVRARLPIHQEEGTP